MNTMIVPKTQAASAAEIAVAPRNNRTGSRLATPCTSSAKAMPGAGHCNQGAASRAKEIVDRAEPRQRGEPPVA